MARAAAVTFEQVAAVANALYAQGVKDPGTKAIREELAKRAGPGIAVGSPNTVQAHLNRWRAESRPVDVQEVPQLPPQLAADISRALTAASAVAREKGEERLAQVQAEFDELVATGEENEARIEELEQELAARTSERDEMAGQLRDRTTEVTELKTTLAAAVDKSAGLERDMHAAQAEAQAANGRVDEIRQATERQLAKLQEDLAQARAGQAEAQRAGVEAEKRAVAAEARLDSERSAKMALDAQLLELHTTAKRLEGEAARAAGAEAAAAGLREQVTTLHDTVSMLRELLQAAGREPPAVPSGAAAGPTKKK